jgi:hypothetical protein
MRILKFDEIQVQYLLDGAPVSGSTSRFNEIEVNIERLVELEDQLFDGVHE